ncbi:phytoene/squalene synthase family protein [Myxococcota bacterium]|nr:phytoene/squalene synthase family protein [Myxococcota bacterium]
MTPEESAAIARVCEETLARNSKSFHFASRFLPRANRADAALLYTFCRAVDDAADERESEVQALEELRRIEDELDGRAERRPLIAAFVEMAARRGIDLRHAKELIVGVRSDMGIVIVADDAELHRYCYRVAGVVGLMMSPLLGVTRREATPHAIDLGIGMQLTNICRDVAEDARMGRVYLPRNRLLAAGVAPETLLAGRDVDRTAVARVVRELLEMAERYYSSADVGMRFIPLRPRSAILVASRVYRAIGRRLARAGFDALAGRTIVPKAGKIVAAIGALASLFAPRVAGLTPARHDAALHDGLRGLPGANVPLILSSGPGAAPSTSPGARVV